MLYTITLNPAWDMTYTAPTVTLGLNRATSCVGKAGGKGINVSRAIGKAGGDSVALAVLGGETGERIRRALTEEGMTVEVLAVEGETRTNISLVGEDGNSLEINGAGTAVHGETVAALVGWLRARLQRGDTLCLCGSLPKGADVGLYGTLCAVGGECGAFVVLDCTGASLLASLDGECPPALIKPNGEELAELYTCRTGKAAPTREDWLYREGGETKVRCDFLRTMAAETVDLAKTAVLCTLGSAGALWMDAEETVFVPAVQVAVAKAEKGAGDTYLGTFLWKRYGCGETVAQAMMDAAAAAGELVAGG